MAQRYQAVLAVISDGETVTDVAARFGARRQTLHKRLDRTRDDPSLRLSSGGSPKSLVPKLRDVQLCQCFLVRAKGFVQPDHDDLGPEILEEDHSLVLELGDLR